MPPKSKKNLSLSQKQTKAPPAKKVKVEKDVAQPSISNFFSSSQVAKPSTDGVVKGNRAPLSTLGASQANNLDRPLDSTQKTDSTATKQVGSSSQAVTKTEDASSSSARGSSSTSIFTSGSKRSRELLHLASQSSTSSPIPKGCSGPSITPSPKTCPGSSVTPTTLVKNRPTVFTCPGPSIPSAGLPGPSPHKLERHATFGLGTDYEPSLSQECHDLLADDDDDDSRLGVEDETAGACKKRCRSFPPARTAPAADPARPLGRGGGAAGGGCRERSKPAVPKMPGRSVSAPVGSLVGKSKELRQIFSKLQTYVKGAQGAARQPGPHQQESAEHSQAHEQEPEARDRGSAHTTAVAATHAPPAPEEAPPSAPDAARANDREEREESKADAAAEDAAEAAAINVESSLSEMESASDKADNAQDAVASAASAVAAAAAEEEVEEEEAVEVEAGRRRRVREPLVLLSDAARVAERDKMLHASAAARGGGGGGAHESGTPAASHGRSLSAKLAAVCGRGADPGGAKGGGARKGAAGAAGARSAELAAAAEEEEERQMIVDVDDLLASLSKAASLAAPPPHARPPPHASAPPCARAAEAAVPRGKGAEGREGTRAQFAEQAGACGGEAEGGGCVAAAPGQVQEDAHGGTQQLPAAHASKRLPGAGAPAAEVALGGEFGSLLDSFFLEGSAPPAQQREGERDSAGAASAGGAPGKAPAVHETPPGDAPSMPALPDLRAAEAARAGEQRGSAVAGEGGVRDGGAAAEEAAGRGRARKVEGVSNAWRDATRYKVAGVSWEEEAGGRRTKVLQLVDEQTGEARTVELEGVWHDTEVHAGERVVVVGPGDFKRGGGGGGAPAQGSLLVVLPQMLVAPTRVGDAFDCARKGVLSERVKDVETNEAALVGNMIHSLFQQVLVGRDWSTRTMEAMAQKAVADNALELCAAGLEERRARELLSELLPSVQLWCDAYLCDAPNPAAPRIRFGRSPEVSLSVSGVRDIEEMVHTSKYGIKGQIDASVEVTVAGGDGGSARRVLMPLEIKSGREYVAHNAQVMLYTFLMKERYPMEDTAQMESGLLVYLKGRKTLGVPVTALELSHIVQGRNLMARHLSSGTLPPLAGDAWKCSKCFKVGVCALYHAAVEQGSKESFGSAEAFEEHAGHLSPEHRAFFRKWEYAISCEEADDIRKRERLWTAPGPEREATGACFARMELLPHSWAAPGDAAGADRTKRVFARFDEDEAYRARFGLHRAMLPQIAISAGDRVTVRVEGGSATAGAGTVVEVTAREVRVELRRGLDEGARVVEEGTTVLWRLDKEEFGGQSGKARLNLANLFLAKGGDEKRRRLVVDLEPPTWREEASAGEATAAGEMPLNEEQRGAVARIVGAQDYLLLHGMPGTGKTTTIAWAVKALVAAGKRVLVSAFTHSAVDHVLVKIGALGVDYLRLCPSEHSVRPEVRPHVLRPDHVRSAHDLNTRLAQVQVVGTTCLNVHTPALRRARFDVCIVDEASQVTLPHCLAPLRLAEAFVLVGDHQQLPPLVTNQEARAILGTSLFKRLCEAHPGSVAALEGQYRMNATIMGLANELVYKHRLRCGSEAVASFRLPAEDAGGSQGLAAKWMRGEGSVAAWVAAVLRPEAALVFVDTSESACAEDKDGGIHNTGEAVAVAVLVEAMCECGLKAEDLGVITPYRAQIKAIRTQLANARAPGAEVSTVDSYQGRDKDCIIMSFVHKNTEGKVGELLADWRRVNVAVTRAKGKLVLVGCKKTLQHNETLKRMMEYAARAGTVVSLGMDGFDSGCPQWAVSEMAAVSQAQQQQTALEATVDQ